MTKTQRLYIVGTKHRSGGRSFGRFKCLRCGNLFTSSTQPCFRRCACHCGKRRIRGLSEHPLYKTWKSMIDRCDNPERLGYDRYGGRGIHVCQRWRNSMDAFIEDMGDKPSAQHTLDRIDNDGDYCPENCRWANTQQQCQNRSSTTWVEIDGEVRCLSDWCQEFGISKGAVWHRVNMAGWSIQKALTTPRMRNRKSGLASIGRK